MNRRSRFVGALLSLVPIAGLVLSGEPRSSDSVPTLRPDNPISVQAPPRPENLAAPSGSEEPSYFGNGNGAAGDRFWGSAEYLLWWVKDGNIPPLVTTSPPDSGGAIGAPGTTVLFGGDLDYGERHGGRFTIGYWLDCDHKIGIEASSFFLGGDSAGFDASSSGTPLLARPFFDAFTGEALAQLVAFPDVVAGSIGISSDSILQGAELNLLCNRWCHKDCTCDSGYRVDLLAGVRYLDLKEDLVIREDLTILQGAPEPFVPGSTITVIDEFETRNRFYGGQVGARGEWWRGRWYVNLMAKVAIGNTHQEVRVNGTTVFTEPGGDPIRQRGGLLALPTNIGHRSRDQFSVAPEIGITVGCQVTERLRAFAGYNFLYWSSVVRPGDQIDLRVNQTQIPDAEGPGELEGPRRPAPFFRDTDFWAQGINFGLEFRW